jgi:toxin ParE1/3/4
MSLNSYVLSQEADNDLEDIFEYTYSEFGLIQAFAYLSNIEELFLKLVQNPEMGRVRNELKNGLYSFPIGKHIVFYRIVIDHIRIVRVLFGGRDLPRLF